MKTATLNSGFFLGSLLVAVMGTGCAGFRGDTAEIWDAAPKTTVAVQRISQPPPGKALVNFHYPLNSWDTVQNSLLGDKPSEQLLLNIGKVAILDGDGQMLIYLPDGCIFQYACDPGEQVFMAWCEPHGSAAVVKADLLPGEIYDILVGTTTGLVHENASLIPLTKENPKRAKLAKFESREGVAVALNPSSPRVAKFEVQLLGQVESVQKDLLNGAKSNRVLYLRPDDHR